MSLFTKFFGSSTAAASGERSPIDIITNRVTARPANATWLSILLGTMGRENSGKTALQMAMDIAVLGQYLQSGLSISAAGNDGLSMTPLDVNTRLKKTFYRLRQLMPGGGGLPTTLAVTPVNYVLCEGEQARLQLLASEEIGQVISRTDSDSTPEELNQYHDFLGRFANSDVKHIIVSPPSRHPSALSEAQWKQDMIEYGAYLNESLRKSKVPVTSVAIVISKIDTLYESADAARAALSHEALKECVRPLVRAIEASPRIKYGAIIPTSVFGFGQAVSVAEPVFEEDESDKFDLGIQDARSHEEGFALRKDSAIEPFNVQALVLWSLLAGALPKEVDVGNGQDEPALARVCRMLSHDLKSINGWIVPVKGDLVG